MNNPKESAMAQLPIIIVLALIFGAGFLMFRGDIKTPFLEKTDSIKVRRLDRFPTTKEVGNKTDKMRRVIKNEDDLDSFFNAIDPSGDLRLGEKINFDQEYLIGVSSKTKDTSGVSVKIKKIIKDQKDGKERFTVMLTQTEQDPETCDVENKKTVALDIIAIDKTDTDFHFERILDEKYCKD